MKQASLKVLLLIRVLKKIIKIGSCILSSEECDKVVSYSEMSCTAVAMLRGTAGDLLGMHQAYTVTCSPCRIIICNTSVEKTDMCILIE